MTTREIATARRVGSGSLTRIQALANIKAMMAIGLIRLTLAETVVEFSDAMQRMKSFIPSLILLTFLANGCGKTPTAVSPPKTAEDTGRTENTESAVVMDSGPKVAATGAVVGDNTNVVEQPISADTATQEEASASGLPVQNLDFRLQDMLRNFHTTGDRNQRSAMATEMGKLVDAGVPKPQIASALGYLFRDENSTDVKTDILNELGNLEDPSAYDQIVAGLDQRQPDEVHAAALEELGDLGDKRAIPLIQPFLTDRDDEVRNAAKSAIDSLNE